MGVCGAPGSWCEQTSQHNAHPLRDQGWAPKGYPGVSAVPAFLPEKGNSVQAPTDCYENAKSYQCLPLSVRCKISSQIGKFNSILSATSSQGAVEPWPKPDCRSQRQPAPYFPSPQPAAHGHTVSPSSPVPEPLPLAPTAHPRHWDLLVTLQPPSTTTQRRLCQAEDIPAGGREREAFLAQGFVRKELSSRMSSGMELQTSSRAQKVLSLPSKILSRHARQRRNPNHIKEKHAHPGKPSALSGFQLRICVPTWNLVLTMYDTEKTDNHTLAL